MFPIEVDAPRPETPHSERIFAASKELHDAYERGDEWTKAKPLHEAYVLFFMETLNDAIGALNDRWDEGGRIGPFPDSLAVQDELKWIICLEETPPAKSGTPDPITYS